MEAENSSPGQPAARARDLSGDDKLLLVEHLLAVSPALNQEKIGSYCLQEL